MSGGFFEYQQYRMSEIIEEIKEIINNNKVEMTQQEIDEQPWLSEDFLNKYPEKKFKHNFSDDTILRFKEGVEALKKAKIYTHRIDWLLSGDDGEENFLIRLNEELNK